VGTVVPTRGDEVLLARNQGAVFVHPGTGVRREIPGPTEEPAGTRFNDGKCDPAGRLWVGTMAFDFHTGGGSLYALDANLQWTRKLPSVTCSNGITWSLDQRTLYYIDTPTGCVEAFDYNRETGAIDRRRILHKVEPGTGHPDGMTIDAEGQLWVALWDGGCVIRIDPATGALTARLPVPGARLVTSCAFGGEGLATLYITTASLLSPEQRAAQPNAGALFTARPGVVGVPAFEFASNP
jgi:sugar lactone lactonase YvrE